MAVLMNTVRSSRLKVRAAATVWEQKDDDDVLTPTRELVASPLLIQVAPKSSQIILLRV